MENATIARKPKRRRTNISDIVHATSTIHELLEILPRTTHNLEPFGVNLMTDTDGKGWTCCYYTHYSNKCDDRLGVCKANTIEGVLKEMIRKFIDKGLRSSLNISNP